MQAQAGTLTTTYSGCQMRPGTYQARWDNGRLKLLIHTSKAKEKEMTFGVVAARPTKSLVASPTTLNISSNPPNAEIDLDGSFVGSTTSTIPVGSGQHIIKITKKGYKPWKRKISTVGGEIKIIADLELQ
jgi:hypothetical protein